MTLVEKQQRMIDDLLLIEDAQERLAVIVDRARRRPALEGAERVEANLVPGCISSAWIAGDVSDGLCHFRSDADSPLVRGLLALYVDLYTGATPAEVIALEPSLVEKLALDRQLSPTRLHGLRSVRARLRGLATSHTAAESG